MVRGPLGSGKSLFVRRMLIEIADRDKEILTPLQSKHSDVQIRFEYFVTIGTCESKLKFLGIWRPILQHLLEISSVAMK